MGRQAEGLLMHLQQFENINEEGAPGRVVVWCMDGSSVVLRPGEHAHVWVLGGRFYKHKPSLWRRFLVWVRLKSSGSTMDRVPE
jgi:hypothetical protein